MDNNEVKITQARSQQYPFSEPYVPDFEQDRIHQEMQWKPVVSVILPCWNAHNTLKRALCSIGMQDMINDIEVILVDDCGDRPYDDIAREFAHMMRIRIVKMLKNGGPGAARQVGIDHSTGKYFTCMDADDTWVSSDAISTMVREMERQQMDCVYGQFLEQNEDGGLYVHEQHMVWMFGKLYRREFIEKWNIRMNTSLSNEDTGYNCLVRGCTERILYIPKPVYIWQFKANSITRIREGMYGSDSGYKGWADNMVWQIEELKKRFINRNYILAEALNTYCVFYHFHVENMQRYPLNTEISLNWARAYWNQVIKPYKEFIDDGMIYQHFTQVAAGQNLAAKGIIPKMTFDEFRDLVEDHDYIVDPDHEICGATPAGHIPEITSPEWPVEITDYYNGVEGWYDVDNDTNKSRYGGMKRALGIEPDPTDYQASYTGAMPLTSSNTALDQPAPEVAEQPPVRSDVNTFNNSVSGKKFGEIVIPPPASNFKVPAPPEFFELEKNAQELAEVRSDLDKAAMEASIIKEDEKVITGLPSLPSFSSEFKPPVGRSFGGAPACGSNCNPCTHCKG